MKVLAILQNQWFKDPERVREILARRPDLRRPFIKRALFVGCRTGRVLRDTLGLTWCSAIIWEEASPHVGGEASSRFPADLDHLCALLAEVKPDVVLALGKIASDALTILVPARQLIIAPHPVARGIDAGKALRNVRVELDNFQ